MEKIGLRLIVVFLILFLIILFIYPLLSILFITMILFTLFFFREPRRVVEDGIVAPSDGKIIYVDDKRLEIFMGLLDCHVSISPCDGVVERVEQLGGSFLPAFREKKNVRNIIFIRNEDGLFRVELVAGFLARRILCYVRTGERIKKGQKIGMIVFGSKTVLEIPEKYRFVRKKGEKVKAGETVAVKK
uniref:Phosphatidylserine decarboxylase n=1 Tax=Geoglobus ahangari TaxID=113653 RepID=A0A7C3YFN1_9EURY